MTRKGISSSSRMEFATLGARIRSVRRAWGWTQGDLASMLGTDQQVVSYWERDKSHPSRGFLKLMADLFRIPEPALLLGKDFTVPEAPASDGDAALLQGLERLLVSPLEDLTLADLDLGGADHPSLTEAFHAIRAARKEGRQILIVIARGSSFSQSQRKVRKG